VHYGAGRGTRVDLDHAARTEAAACSSTPAEPPGAVSPEAIAQRALDIGDAEGLDAITLRRLASELGVTPMALYRHVHDKQDRVNAMYEAIVDGFDLKAGVRASMQSTNQLRRSLMNVIALPGDARQEAEARPAPRFADRRELTINRQLGYDGVTDIERARNHCVKY
jgi:AcrR family transcriptional regulator